ncbi:hypothetical protein ILUMI_24252 [Ignelater luminosus]|uniref:DDE Tnp4 domain-containing protein n=1 Tax=Ignelater luminosus TaxID=2038154 RepID=A0A8K0FYX5_IGNLU|nr:hypothetical protein ILUMI_24252 [Ignelater luminosus]
MGDMSTGSNESWLNATIKFLLYNELLEKKRGRKRLLFDEASDCSKRMRTLQLQQNYLADELSYAAQMSLRSDGRVEASKLVKEITTTSPKRAEPHRKGLPEVLGISDGCHIEIKQSVNNAVDFFNRKKTHRIVLQAVCNDNGLLTDVIIGIPGRVHDARVFRQRDDDDVIEFESFNDVNNYQIDRNENSQPNDGNSGAYKRDFIANVLPTPKKRTKPFLKETVEMLLPADTVTEAVSSDDENLAEAAEESSDEPWMSSPDEQFFSGFFK